MVTFTQQEVNSYYGRKAPKLPAAPDDAEALEGGLHDKIFDECRRRGWIAFHGSMAERTHRTEGEPDFTILADRKRFFLIECKSKTGKPSKAQNELHAHATKLGHDVFVVRSFSEFLEVLA